MKVYIYGCSAFGVEVESWLRQSRLFLENQMIDSINFAGFLGDRKYIQDEYLHLWSGSIDMLTPNDGVILAIGENLHFKESLAKQLWGKVQFPNMIHKTSLNTTTNIGVGNILSLFCNLSTMSSIGNFNLFNAHSGVGHNVIMGDFNTISAYSDMLGYSKIGHKNKFGVASHLLPKAQIGDNNTIAPGSIIYKRFRDDNLISGNPATAQIRAMGGGR